MRGAPGDPIKLIILKPDNTEVELNVVRQIVRGRAVRHRIEKGYGYVYIETFNNSKLTEDLIDALNSITKGLNGDLPGLIIDLRGNRGGLLEQSVKVSSLFLDGGEVLSAKGKKLQDIQRYHAEQGELLPDTPIVIIINSGSASAAEIVAGALQDRGRAVVVGRRSFGKGSVQSVIPLSRGNGALKITTQRYYTPSGESIQGRGIMPDVLVAITSDTGKIKKRLREDSLRNSLSNKDDTNFKEVYKKIIYPSDDWNSSDDFQLHKAIELLSLEQYDEIIESNMSIESFN
jgi:carboxyl-terminal processing protease